MIHIPNEYTGVLILLFIAHFLADFLFQTERIAEQKKGLNKFMLLHITIVLVSSILLTQLFIVPIIIAALHLIIDVVKSQYRNDSNETQLFYIDQVAHLFSIFLVWMVSFDVTPDIWSNIQHILTSPEISIILLGFIIVIWPYSIVLQKILAKFETPAIPDIEGNQTKSGGKIIGIFERIIILSLTLIGEFSSIGFLITGKSIIRLARRNEHIKSEYILIGTMVSYGLTIALGISINIFLRNFQSIS